MSGKEIWNFLCMWQKQKMKQENSEKWGDQVFIDWKDIFFGRSDLMNFMQNGKPCISVKFLFSVFAPHDVHKK